MAESCEKQNYKTRDLMKVFPVFLLLLSFFLLTCGIEEFFYLPQVPESSIKVSMNANATISIPSIDSVEYYYFTNYAIYYKLYTGADYYSDLSFNTDLRNDYNAFFPYTNPANTTSGGSIDNLFKTRNYYELKFEGESNNSMMPSTGGTLEITFPTSNIEYPYASLRNTSKSNVRLCRSINEPVPDQFLLNSPELREDTRNTDVSKRGGDYVCISMYIVVVGYDNKLFKPIFSKPTFIENFILAD